MSSSHLRTDDDKRYVLRNDATGIWIWDQVGMLSIETLAAQHGKVELNEIDWVFLYLENLNTEDHMYRSLVSQYIEEGNRSSTSLFTTPFKAVFIDWSKVNLDV
jgi:hypothetical protein